MAKWQYPPVDLLEKLRWSARIGGGVELSRLALVWPQLALFDLAMLALPLLIRKDGELLRLSNSYPWARIGLFVVDSVDRHSTYYYRIALLKMELKITIAIQTKGSRPPAAICTQNLFIDYTAFIDQLNDSRLVAWLRFPGKVSCLIIQFTF